MSQTVINTAGQAAELMVVGTIADPGPHKVDSAYNSEVSAEMAFGIGVRRGAADDAALILAAASTPGDFAGVVVHTHAIFRPDALGTTGVKPKKSFGLLRLGCVWVFAEDAVTLASGVFLRVGGTGVVGAFRGTDDAADAVDISAVAAWRTSAGAGGVAKLEVMLIGV